jgi:hypothetical protein
VGNDDRQIMINSTHLRRYSFVTVGFEGDAGLLNLQARSMRMFCPPELIEEIIIVDNSSPGSRNWRDELLHQYGNHAGFVRIVPAASIVAISKDTNGWLTQQILKIKVASIVRSERYVILDAKNHLIARLGLEFLETPTGQPRANGYPYFDHFMRQYLERTLDYLGIDPKPHISWFIRTHTPFIMLTNEASELVRNVEQREARPFASVFLDRKLSEFFLYSGFLVSKGTLQQIYDLTQTHEPQVWPENADEQGCAEAIRNAEQTGCPFITVHRRALAKMNKNGQTLLADFWHSRGLFASTKDGLRFLRDPNRSYQNPEGRVVSWPVSRIAAHFRVPDRGSVNPSPLGDG